TGSVQIDGQNAAIRIGGQQRCDACGVVKRQGEGRSELAARVGKGQSRQGQAEAEAATVGEALKGVVVCRVVDQSQRAGQRPDCVPGEGGGPLLLSDGQRSPAAEFVFVSGVMESNARVSRCSTTRVRRQGLRITIGYFGNLG